MRPAAALLALTAVLTACSSTGTSPAPVAAGAPADVLELTPETLRGPDPAGLAREAQAAYGEKRYADAARLYAELLSRRPDQPIAWYNLACCYALLGSGGQAARFLEAAWDAGFHDLAQVEADRDFDGVRKERAFARTVKRLRDRAEREQARTGRTFELPSRVMATVKILEPAGMRDGERYPLVIGLHGAGGDAGHLLPAFVDAGVPARFIFCAPQGPYAVPGRDAPGFVWFRGLPEAPRTPTPESRRLTEEYVLSVVEAVKRAYPVDERHVYLLGFSQGAHVAFDVGLRHPEVFAGVIPIGGWLRPDDYAGTELERARKEGRFLVVHSREDRAVAWEECERSTALLRSRGIDFSLLSYRGGHVLTGDVMRGAAAWMGLQVSVAPEPPAGP